MLNNLILNRLIRTYSMHQLMNNYPCENTPLTQCDLLPPTASSNMTAASSALSYMNIILLACSWSKFNACFCMIFRHGFSNDTSFQRICNYYKGITYKFCNHFINYSCLVLWLTEFRRYEIWNHTSSPFLLLINYTIFCIIEQ